MIIHGITPDASLAGQRAALEIKLAKDIAETLHKEYPGHAWGVNVTKGIVDIRDLSLSGRWGFTLHVLKLGSDWRRKVTRAAGELLERYRVKRGRLNVEHLMSMRRDFKGELDCDRN